MNTLRAKIIGILSLLAFLISSKTTTAQLWWTQQQRSSAKYNSAFDGIGPIAYFLPAPRTKAEIITADFAEINSFKDSILQAYALQSLLLDFKNTSYTSGVAKQMQMNNIATDNWDKIANQYVNNDSASVAVEYLNTLAKLAISNKKNEKAELFLNKALDITTTENMTNETNNVLSNLLSLYLFSNKTAEATRIQNSYYQSAVAQKSLTLQGNSLVKKALIEANKQNFDEAEKIIIRQAIPLFNRDKNYDAKIKTWVQLSEIYRQQNRHTEAQWFLIQAKDLASSERINTYDVIIEYLLGSSKFEQDNLKVSENELRQALLLTETANNDFLRLSTLQLLGQIQLKQNKVEEAEHFLNAYWKLRKKLF